MSALGRIKRGVRAAVAINGGVDGAAATAKRGRSTAGDWNNLHSDNYPTVNSAYALDEVAIVEGKAPPILFAYAAELGHVAIRLPDPGQGVDAITGAFVEASTEFGDVAEALRDAVRDQKWEPNEKTRTIREIDDAMAALARMRALLTVGDAA